METRLLPHSLPNAGVRMTDPHGTVLVYTGDTGPSPLVPELAHGADLLLSDATHPEVVLADDGLLLTARQAGEYAAQAGAAELMLTHLWPGTPHADAIRAARRSFPRPLARHPRADHTVGHPALVGPGREEAGRPGRYTLSHPALTKG